MGRRPRGAWRTNGPPAGSLVVCGWGRPAAVDAGAIAVVVGVVMASSYEDRGEVGGVMRQRAGPGISPRLPLPQPDGALRQVEQHDRDQHQDEPTPVKHPSSTASAR